MAEKTGIAWTEHTWNPWIGCTEVSPGCDHCYARALDKRHRYGGMEHWGAGVPRYRTKDWTKPRTWNRKAEKEGRRAFVFPSMCDPFDNEVLAHNRDDLFDLIGATPHLTWLLLSKRIGNAAKMLAGRVPAENVWLGSSVVNQEEADRDIPKLLATPAAKRFVSYEPALGPVDFSKWLSPRAHVNWGDNHSPTEQDQRSVLAIAKAAYRQLGGALLDWVIIGGESTQGGAARPFYRSWAQSTVAQCRRAGVAVFVKQMGSFVVDRNDAGFDGCDPEAWPLRPDGCDPVVEHNIHGYCEEYQGADCRIRLASRAGADPAEWPEVLRVQEFPA